MARRRPQLAPRSTRWLDRVFWLGVLALAVWFSFERVVVPVMHESGYRRVEGYRAELLAAAEEFDLDPNLLAAVALAESSGRVDAVSSVGALGLFQLMLPTARERARLLGLEEPSRERLLGDARLSARLAASYLDWLGRRYDDDVERMLIAYNAGPGRLDGWIRAARDYPAWRAERSETSGVLGYACKVQRYREHFARRGRLEPVFDQPPVPAVLSTAPATVGPPLPRPIDERP